MLIDTDRVPAGAERSLVQVQSRALFISRWVAQPSGSCGDTGRRAQRTGPWVHPRLHLGYAGVCELRRCECRGTILLAVRCSARARDPLRPECGRWSRPCSATSAALRRLASGLIWSRCTRSLAAGSRAPTGPSSVMAALSRSTWAMGRWPSSAFPWRTRTMSFVPLEQRSSSARHSPSSMTGSSGAGGRAECAHGPQHWGCRSSAMTRREAGRPSVTPSTSRSNSRRPPGRDRCWSENKPPGSCEERQPRSRRSPLAEGKARPFPPGDWSRGLGDRRAAPLECDAFVGRTASSGSFGRHSPRSWPADPQVRHGARPGWHRQVALGAGVPGRRLRGGKGRGRALSALRRSDHLLAAGRIVRGLAGAADEAALCPGQGSRNSDRRRRA